MELVNRKCDSRPNFCPSPKHVLKIYIFIATSSKCRVFD
jgi:hypothetical protein